MPEKEVYMAMLELQESMQAEIELKAVKSKEKATFLVVQISIFMYICTGMLFNNSLLPN